MNKINLLVAAILLMLAAASQAAEVAGNVGYMSGRLMVQRADGTVKIMGPKSEVLAVDTLVTAKDSYVQVKMKDGAKMTLRPNSTLKIEEFRFNKQEPKSDNAIFRLLKGGFRTVTGLIGKRGDPDAYKVRASAATIGIRGTDFSTRLCATPDCQDDAAAPAKQSAIPPTPPVQAAWQAAQAMRLWKILAVPLKAMMTTATADNPPPVAAPQYVTVTVHTGNVIMAQANNSLNLGRDESGWASATTLVRLPKPPKYMQEEKQQTDAIETKARKAEEKSGGKPAEGTSDGKSDKEKADPKSGEDNKDAKQDEDKADSKPDEDKTDSKPEGEKGSAEPEGEKDSGKPEGEKGNGQPEGENDSGKPEAGSKPESIAPEEMNADSPDPTINKGGCVVRGG